jgi:electron transfer flavoprotein alpha subunit
LKGSKSPKVIHENVNNLIQENHSRYKVIDFIKGDPKTIDIVEADIIVAGGRGLERAKGFQVLKEFANEIGGAVGCTRPIVDENILPPERQIGQTGKTVSPYLFISCGISGAIQHLMGIKEAKHIVAINIDPKAPIFRLSELKIIGDVNQLLPIFSKKIKEYKELTRKIT